MYRDILLLRLESKRGTFVFIEKANAQQETVSGEEGDKKYFIAANPHFKNVDLFDAAGKKIEREGLLQPEQRPVRNLKQREHQKEDASKKSSRVRQKYTFK